MGQKSFERGLFVDDSKSGRLFAMNRGLFFTSKMTFDSRSGKVNINVNASPVMIALAVVVLAFVIFTAFDSLMGVSGGVIVPIVVTVLFAFGLWVVCFVTSLMYFSKRFLTWFDSYRMTAVARW